MAEPRQALEAIGTLPDPEIDPGPAALQLARLDAPHSDWLAASEHLSELAREAAAIGTVLSGRSSEARAGALAALLHVRFGYRGDSETYDDLDNASLIRVIERRRGLPVALGVLWLHCIRAAGWEGSGVDFPGHFLVALAGTPPALIDAFDCGATLATPDLLALLRRVSGAERPLQPRTLQPGMLRPMPTRDVLLRLQRNLVQRRLLAGAVEAALGSLEGMILIAPDMASNWLNAADLNRQLGRTDAAIACLERFLALVPQGEAASLARSQLDLLRHRGV